MRIKFCYWDLSEYRKNCHHESTKIRRAFEMLDTPGNVGWAYGKYLLSSLDSDFSENEFGACDYLLEEIEKIESGETESYIYESNGFTHYIGRNSVTFEHSIFGICPHWPLWSCPFTHYKIALQAARDFYALPESMDTELIIELPESDMAQVTLFPPILAENEMALEKNPRN
jgi:hypothetical protein